MTRCISWMTGAMKSPRRSTASVWIAGRKGAATDRKRTAGNDPAAVHEAGHAVVAVLLGLKARATLDHGRPGCGACEIDVPESPEGAERLLVALVAGGEAEGRLLGQPRRWLASTDDAKAMLRVVGGLARPGAAERIAHAKRDAAHLLRERPVWRATEAIAAELTRHARVDDATVRGALAEAGLAPRISPGAGSSPPRSPASRDRTR
jgi:hypothetical protein